MQLPKSTKTSNSNAQGTANKVHLTWPGEEEDEKTKKPEGEEPAGRAEEREKTMQNRERCQEEREKTTGEGSAKQKDRRCRAKEN